MKRAVVVIFLSLFAVATMLGGIAIAKSDKCNEFIFDATKSKAHGKGQLTYMWDFGDGTTSDAPVVTHKYEKGGQYTVKLTVKDESGMECDTGMASQVVNANTPPIAKFSAPDAVCVGTEVSFDASASSSDTSKNLTYMWDFGDGKKAEGVRVTHTYAKGGNYKVNLTVDDNLGTDCSTACSLACIRVNTAPVARAGEDITMCSVKRADENRVDFSGSGSDADGDALSYTWDFGDGATAPGAKASHVYAKSGTYNATLIVNDGSGTDCSTASDTLVVTIGKELIARAGKTICICLGEEAVFDGSESYAGEGGKAIYSWNFGDGTKGDGVKTSHVYTKGGVYTAVLTVSNETATGACGTKISASSTRVVVNAAPVAVLAKAGPVCVGDKVMFDGSGSYDPDSDGSCMTYHWDFGDGVVMEGKSKEAHVYSKGGMYKVKLMVDDGSGTRCATSETVIDLKVNTAPVAKVGTCTICCVGLEGTFDGSGSYDDDGDSLRYMWDFGDGTTGTGAKTTHTYTRAGTYTVKLMVDDGMGTSCSASSECFETTIHANPDAVFSVKNASGKGDKACTWN